ncbi:hypothetical protein EZ428_21560 [Pedobacter frigiditerrae]|uniref:Uncharacterized protein n=1 Tax=Pedobacter frigiditerrae TaxID=2530452 RepID=A0A4R0MM94_9SPHI|nr:hypothetical protein [Pedobacter frigiditerrae]TCC87292.1 hypothetical protein EZ428_21560 [Pedobacter frigiditerrae]
MRKYILIVAIFLMSCNRKESKDQLVDKDLVINALKASVENGALTYKVRIFHHFKGTALEGQKMNEKMAYRMDSSFYKVSEMGKQYADELIPIANGLNNCFEYMVVFYNSNAGENNLTYKDKYITGKTYQLSLKQDE